MSYKTLVALGIVLAAAAGGYFIQKTYSQPQMKGMDTEVRTPQSTTYPVTVAAAESGPIAGTITYTGTVAAYIEEDVYPRVTGRIVAMSVYPGDHVEPGQVVAKLDDIELSSRVREAASAVVASEANLAQMEADVLAARHGVTQMERELAMATAEVGQARDGIAQMEQELAMVTAEVAVARDGVVQMEKELSMVEAEAGYQQSVAARDERLVSKGAISRQEAENSQAMAAAARAKVQATQAKVQQAKAMVVAAQAKVQAAQAKVQQAKAMVVAAQAKVQAAQAKVQQAMAMEASTLKKWEAMGGMLTQSQAMQRTAEVVHDYVNIRTAAGGHVVKRLIAPGTLVQPGMPVLKIAQLDRVRFQANVAERDVARLRVGSRVNVRVSGQEKQPLNLNVTSVFPFAEGAARTAIVEAVAANSGRRFLPGQYATMEFEVDRVADAVTVPRSAVVQTSNSAAIWVVANDTASSREISTGPANAERVAVLKNLSAGELVVVRGHEGLYDGVKVAVDGQVPAAAGNASGTMEMPSSEKESGKLTGMQDMAGRGMDTKVTRTPFKGQEAGTLRINLTTIPATLRAGNARLRIEVKDSTGALVSGAKVEVLASMAGMAVPKVTARAAKEPGIYEAAVSLGMSGALGVDVTVVHPRGGTTSAKFNLEVK